MSSQPEPGTMVAQPEQEELSSAQIRVTSQQQQTGIDIHKALDILSLRSANSVDDHDHDHSHSSEGGGCHAHQTESKRTMGQTIDLESSTNNTSTSGSAEPSGKDAEAIQKEQQERRKERAAELEAKLQSMSVKELLQTVMETQQQRVATYQKYNESVNHVLESGNMSAYMTSCAHATASFSVLSETIIAIRKALVDIHNRKDLEKLLTNLQKHEKEKLNLTAALHLERIREQNENVGSVDGADKRISRLLSEGVIALREKVNSCVEEINESLEEIRYALIEEDDEDEDMQS